MNSGKKTTRPEQDAHVTLWIKEVKREIIEESLHHSTYRDLSTFLRGVSTGWDPRGPIAAKAGIALCWTGARLGMNVGRREWEELERLFGALLGTKSLERGLRLAEKHVLAALMATDPESADPASANSGSTAPKGRTPESEGSQGESPLGLIGRRGAGRRVRRRLLEEGRRNCKLSFGISSKRLALIDRAVEQEGYSSRSAYIRAMACGQDRSWEMLARGALALFWARSHAGEELSSVEWLRLDGLMRENVGGYLFPSECLPGESVPSGSLKSSASSTGSFATDRPLWQAGAHLLAADPEAISTETGLPYE